MHITQQALLSKPQRKYFGIQTENKKWTPSGVHREKIYLNMRVSSFGCGTWHDTNGQKHTPFLSDFQTKGRKKALTFITAFAALTITKKIWERTTCEGSVLLYFNCCSHVADENNFLETQLNIFSEWFSKIRLPTQFSLPIRSTSKVPWDQLRESITFPEFTLWSVRELKFAMLGCK